DDEVPAAALKVEGRRVPDGQRVGDCVERTGRRVPGLDLCAEPRGSARHGEFLRRDGAPRIDDEPDALLREAAVVLGLPVGGLLAVDCVWRLAVVFVAVASVADGIEGRRVDEMDWA